MREGLRTGLFSYKEELREGKCRRSRGVIRLSDNSKTNEEESTQTNKTEEKQN